jgi:hypothetical protein
MSICQIQNQWFKFTISKVEYTNFSARIVTKNILDRQEDRFTRGIKNTAKILKQETIRRSSRDIWSKIIIQYYERCPCIKMGGGTRTLYRRLCL